MENVIIDDLRSFHKIGERLSTLKAPISVSLGGRLIPFRTDDELASFINGFLIAWDVMDDISQSAMDELRQAISED